MVVLDALIGCSVKKTIVECFSTDQKQIKAVKRVNNQFFDQLVSEQK